MNNGKVVAIADVSGPTIVIDGADAEDCVMITIFIH